MWEERAIRFSLMMGLSFIHGICLAQFQQFSDQIFFKRFNTDKGLSQASVNTILHDSKGFMWFGTDDGLNRFDGSHFKIFRKHAGDSTSVVGNTIHALLEDNEGNLWVGTSEGISRFDRHLERFARYALKDAEYYSCFDLKWEPSKTKLWVAAATHGLAYIDLPSGKMHSYTHEKLRNVNVQKIEIINSKLFIGTMGNGLLCLDLINNSIEEIELFSSASPRTWFAVRSMLADDNILWVGLEGGGLIKLNTLNNEVKNFSTADNSLSDDKVWALAKHNTSLWIGTDGGGLTVLNSETETSRFYKHAAYDTRSISSNTIRSILADDNNQLWFGTFNGGISYLPDFSINFLTFRKDPENPFSLSHNAVLSFCDYKDGMFLIGTDGGGLNYLKNGKFYRYKFPNHVDDPNVILSIHKLTTGGLLIGTYQDGLIYIRPDGKTFQYKNDPSDMKSIGSNIVWDIEEDDNGNIWLATEFGINRFDLKTSEFTHYKNKKSDDSALVFTNDFIQTLLIDSEQTLWGGFYGYLLSYQLKTGSVKRFESASDSLQPGVPNSQILSLYQDAVNKDLIWFGAMGVGLVKLNVREQHFTTITEKDGLPNSLIFAIHGDDKGKIWLTTNKGLVNYNPLENNFFIFDENHGVDIAPFKDNAALMNSEGYLLFGGTNGFVSFLPADLTFSKRGLNVVFTSFQLFNEEAAIDGRILKKSITETDDIELTYDQARFISLEFSALQFLAPSDIQYQYKLEGFDDTWQAVGNKRVSFTNLFPGNYILKVKAAYSAGQWGDERMIRITVVPPWWMTWYARVAMLIFALGSGYGFLRYRTYNLKKRKLELEKIVAEQNRAIHIKNMELESQNEELTQHNEELLTHRETISLQNKMLHEAQEQLKEINQSLEDQVHNRTEKLHRTIKELDAFLYSASHDLVAPLKSIYGLVNLAKLENGQNHVNPYFDHIEISVRKLESVIQTLMQHSFNSKAISKLQPVDVKGLAHETISELKFMPEARRIHFNLAFEKEVVTTDTDRLKIILSNLLSNSIKYHDPKKELNQVNLHFHKNATSWTLEICDNGIGIEKERLPLVFDMFYRATENAKGSGLGLYIVKETVERLNGRIRIESEYGLWTKFVCTFNKKELEV